MTTITLLAPQVKPESLTSPLPAPDGRGLSPRELTFVTAHRNHAEYRAGRYADAEGDAFQSECGRVAASVALRVVLSRRPEAYLDSDDTTDYEVLAAYGLHPVAGGSLCWDELAGDALALDMLERGLDCGGRPETPDGYEMECKGVLAGHDLD